MSEEAITEVKARKILAEISYDEWCRPIMDHLAAKWALDRITQLESELAVADGERSRWKESCVSKRDDLEVWYAAAREADVPKWDGKKYSSEEEWARRVFSRIEKMRHDVLLAPLGSEVGTISMRRTAARRTTPAENPGKRIAEDILRNHVQSFHLPKASIDVVDLFCGCGGISAGISLVSAVTPAFRSAAAVDIDADAIDTFRLNLGIDPINADVHELVTDKAAWRRFGRKLDRKEGNELLVVGGPPCQGFSSHRIKIEGCEEMNSLVPDFVTAAVRLSADAILMENVPELVTVRSWPYYEQAAQYLRDHGYTVRTRVYNFAGFGLPQERFRVVTIAMRKPFAMPVPFIVRDDYRTVRNAIAHLPVVEPGVPYADDPDHITAKHRSSTVATIALVPKNGGRRPLDAGPDCLRRLAARNGRTGYDDVYGRLAWDRPSVTITGHCRNPASGRFSHPEQDRGLSVREAALLQGFPPNFRFVGGTESRFLQVGNAVSPIVAAFLAGHILGELRADRPESPDLEGDVTKPVGTSFSRLIPGIKNGSLGL